MIVPTRFMTVTLPHEPIVRFEVPGPVVTKLRPRFGQGRVRNEPKHKAWLQLGEMLARRAWRGRGPLIDPVIVHVVCWFQRPKRLMRVMDRETGTAPHTVRPDPDNAAGLPLDAMVNAGVLKDDTIVARLIVDKLYPPLLSTGRLAWKPCTEVCVMPYEWP